MTDCSENVHAEHHNCLRNDLQLANISLMNAKEEDYEIECNLSWKFWETMTKQTEQMAVNHALYCWIEWRIYDTENEIW